MLNEYKQCAHYLSLGSIRDADVMSDLLSLLSFQGSGAPIGGGFVPVDTSSAFTIAQAAPPLPTMFTVGGPGPGYIRDLLGPNSVPSAQVGADPDLAYTRSRNPTHQAIGDYLSQMIAEGRDLDPNVNVEKRYAAGTAFELNGQLIQVIDTNSLPGYAYHNFNGDVNRARDYVATNELADASARRAMPMASDPEIETIGQSVNARIDKSVSFADIMNWQADVRIMSQEPQGSTGRLIGEVISRNYANLFNQNDNAINSVFEENGINATAADFNRAFTAYRAGPANSNVPRSQLMTNFTNQFVQQNTAPGSSVSGAVILDQMETRSQQNLQQSAEGIAQNYLGTQSLTDTSSLLAGGYTPDPILPN